MPNIYTYKLGIARCFFALSLLLTLLSSDKNVLFSETNHLNPPDSFLEKCNLFLVFGYENLHLSYGISIIILLLVILGFHAKFTGILHWWVAFSFYNASIIIDVGDQMTQIFTFLLIPITLFDPRDNHYKNASLVKKHTEKISSAFWMVLKIQAALIFLENSTVKILIFDDWNQGNNFFYWVNHNIFGRDDLFSTALNGLDKIPFINPAIIFVVIIFKLSLFGAIFITGKVIKRRLFIFAVALYSVVYIYCGLISILLSMIGVLIIYLLDLKDGSFMYSRKVTSKMITKKCLSES